MAQLLIIVRVPEVEPYIGRLRAQFDPSAKRGLGAHVTVLHSNMPVGGIEPNALRQIAAAVSSLTPFEYQITRVARFPGTLYLAAEPSASFVLLRSRLVGALPIDEREHRGKESLIPHVSIVRKSATDDREVETEIAATLERHGPISCVCKEIVLLENSSGAWRPVQEFALSGGTGTLGQGLS